MPTNPDRELEWSVEELRQRLLAGEPLFVLDVRNRDEFERWRLEGRGELPIRNEPYFDLLEEGGEDDMVDSVEAVARGRLAGELPEDRPILALCPKGGTSLHVAEGLRRLGLDAYSLAGGTQAWSDHVDFRVVEEGEELTLVQVQRPARGCLGYVVASGGEALVVDPFRRVEPITAWARERGLEIVAVLDTHGHADHISGGPRLAWELGVPYYLHPFDGIHPIDALPATIPFDYLREGQELRVGSVGIEVLHVPGHTLGEVVLRVASRYLLSGDTIFVASIARPDLGGRADVWAPLHYRSLERLLGLPEETVVLPGHYSSLAEADGEGVVRGVLGELRRTNRDLAKVDEGEEVFVAHILASLPEFPDEYVEIKRVNAGLSRPDEEAAAELETGKNICALAAAAG